MAISDKETNQLPVAFRWTYIVLPNTVLIVSLVLVAVFYSRLPAELAYHFDGDGNPDRWLVRNQIIFLTLFPQFTLAIVAAATALLMTKLSARFPPKAQASIMARKIITLMGNMIALPQIILAYFMIYVFFFNVFQIKLLSIWIFATVVTVAGGAILGSLLLGMLREARRTIK